MREIPFAYSIHPGEILRTEFMEPLGLSSDRLAKELHVSAPRVNDIVLGKRSIKAYTAIRLTAYFGNSAEFWLGLQMDRDLWVAATNEQRDPPPAKVKPRAQAAALLPPPGA